MRGPAELKEAEWDRIVALDLKRSCPALIGVPRRHAAINISSFAATRRTRYRYIARPKSGAAQGNRAIAIMLGLMHTLPILPPVAWRHGGSGRVG